MQRPFFEKCLTAGLLAFACAAVTTISRPFAASHSLPLQATATPAPAAPQGQPPATQPASPSPRSISGTVIVLDAAHGGTDNGARGPNGLNEKDLVLSMARAIRNELGRQGFRVVMTRDSDADPSWDDRAATANAIRNAIFISLHVGSTGPAGTVRIYYYRFSTPYTYAASLPGPPAAASSAPAASAAGNGDLVAWRDAQQPFDDASHRLGDLLAGALAAKYAGSPALAIAAPVRVLRSVEAPAIAVEISSVAVPNPAVAGGMAIPIAGAIAQSVNGFPTAPAAAGGSTGGPGATP